MVGDREVDGCKVQEQNWGFLGGGGWEGLCGGGEGVVLDVRLQTGREGVAWRFPGQQKVCLH